jgi:hypothetical protein
MIIRQSIWEQIRDEFTSDEKAAMSRAFRGEMICPRGFIVNPDALEAALREKLIWLTGASRKDRSSC